jgi:hypothetical protein
MPMLDFPSNYVPDGEAEKLPPIALGILAGATDEQLSKAAEDYLAGRDFLYTLAVMCSPKSDVEASRVMNAQSLDELYHAIGFVEEFGLDGVVSGSLTREIADREDVRELMKKLIETDAVGHIASGYILRWIVSRWQTSDTRNQGSLARAARAVEEWGKSHKIVGTGKQHITRHVWAKYSSVSHLWAALHLMEEAEINASTSSGFVLFCSTAQWLLEQGAAIVPMGRRDGDAILSLDSAWSIPGSFVQRTQKGSIVHLWSAEPGAHDIREMRRGFSS